MRISEIPMATVAVCRTFVTQQPRHRTFASMQPSVPAECLSSQDFDWITFVISLGLAVGVVLSYLPQVAVV